MAEDLNNLFAVQEDNEQNTTEQVAEVAEETTTEQTEEELSPFQQKIVAEMQRRAEQGDTLLATALQSKDKTIAECTKYLNHRAEQLIEKSARQGAVCIQVDDDEVYGWAHHYYIESKENIEKEMPAPKHYEPVKREKTAEQKKAEETAKKVNENPLLSALLKRGAKMAQNGEIAVTKTTEKKDAEGKLLSTKTTKTNADGTRTTSITKNGQTYTMTEFSLF